MGPDREERSALQESSIDARKPQILHFQFSWNLHPGSKSVQDNIGAEEEISERAESSESLSILPFWKLLASGSVFNHSND
jgi:hypothetical protein